MMRPVGVKQVLLVVALTACACPKKHGEPVSAGQGSGSQSEAMPVADVCTGAKPHVERLYRADAQQAEPKRVEEAMADNTRMVMTDCAQDPVRVSACVRDAKSVKDLEANCLSRVDEAGNPVKR